MSALERFQQSRWGRMLIALLPGTFLLLLFVLPFVMLVRISLTDQMVSGSPFAPLWVESNGALTINVQWRTYLAIVGTFDESGAFTLGWTPFLSAYSNSLVYALLTAVFTLLIGYPFAYWMTTLGVVGRTVALCAVMLPFWTSFVMRVSAWRALLSDEGYLNTWAQWLGADGPFQIMYTQSAVVLGMVYVYLPFAVLPLYATLRALDKRHREAAADLGATPWTTFWLVTVPQTRRAIGSACALVFVPCLGEFVIPAVLGGSQTPLIGRVIWEQMFSANNWAQAAALAVLMILTALGALHLIFKLTQDKESKR